MPPVSPKEKHEDDEAAGIIHIFILELAAARWVVSSRLELTFPWAVCCLIDDCVDVVRRGLAKMKIWWVRLQQLDDQAKASLKAAEFRSSLLWPLWDWPRVVFIVLAEHEFEHVI